MAEDQVDFEFVAEELHEHSDLITTTLDDMQDQLQTLISQDYF